MRPTAPASVLKLLLFLLLPALLHAGPWEDANAAFADGAYSRALPLYQESIDRDGPSAARLLNLGNTYAKLNLTGPAVLALERAAMLAPRDADIQTSLKAVRPSFLTPLPEPPWWQSPLHWLSLHEWSWLTALGLVMTALSIAAWAVPFAGFSKLSGLPAFAFLQRWKTPGLSKLGARIGLGLALGGSQDGRRIRHMLPWIFGCGLFLGLSGTLALVIRQPETNLAILTAGEPALLLSPFENAEPISAPPPHPGQAVIPGEVHGDWVHLSIPGTDNAGWAPSKDVALIIPPPPRTSGK
ncbi:MAG: tetratricopeptide repeat protein [Verrucomicrobiales bacterium]|nr:tetratricopeptide repeat protein [Verrucomicrobiales bacterium]